MSLLYSWTYFSILVIIIAHSVHYILGYTPEDYMAPFGTMKASHQRVSFLVSTSLISLCPIAELCGIFSYSVLSSSGEQ